LLSNQMHHLQCIHSVVYLQNFIFKKSYVISYAKEKLSENFFIIDCKFVLNFYSSCINCWSTCARAAVPLIPDRE
jgi:hypothetical protein